MVRGHRSRAQYGERSTRLQISSAASHEVPRVGLDHLRALQQFVRLAGRHDAPFFQNGCLARDFHRHAAPPATPPCRRSNRCGGCLEHGEHDTLCRLGHAGVLACGSDRPTPSPARQGRGRGCQAGSSASRELPLGARNRSLDQQERRGRCRGNLGSSASTEHTPRTGQKHRAAGCARVTPSASRLRESHAQYKRTRSAGCWLSTAWSFPKELDTSLRACLSEDGEDRDIFEGYADGFDARIKEVLADRQHLLPRQFIDAGFDPVPWTGYDVAMIWVGTMANRFSNGSDDPRMRSTKRARRRDRRSTLGDSRELDGLIRRARLSVHVDERCRRGVRPFQGDPLPLFLRRGRASADDRRRARLQVAGRRQEHRSRSARMRWRRFGRSFARPGSTSH